jgi:hypothetical protein
VPQERRGQRRVGARVPGLPPDRVTGDGNERHRGNDDDGDDVLPAPFGHLPRLRHRSGEFVLFESVSFSGFHVCLCLDSACSLAWAREDQRARPVEPRAVLRLA